MALKKKTKKDEQMELLNRILFLLENLNLRVSGIENKLASNVSIQYVQDFDNQYPVYVATLGPYPNSACTYCGSNTYKTDSNNPTVVEILHNPGCTFAKDTVFTIQTNTTASGKF